MQAFKNNSARMGFNGLTALSYFKQWSKSAYKCTRQIVSEKLGKCNRTIDPELDSAIENIKEVKTRYENILCLAKKLTEHFQNIVVTQNQLADAFADLARSSPELIDEFTINAEIQRSFLKNGETLILELTKFHSNLSTLCSKTIEDTLITIHQYEAARLEYDANRTELEKLQMMPFSDKKDQLISKFELETNFFRERFEKLRKDVEIKLKFLDDNRIKVMKKQLDIFQSAISSYFSGNRQSLETTLNQINSTLSIIKSDTSDSGFKLESFLDSTSIN